MYSETFSVGVPQLEITGLPDILANLSCILGKKVNLPKVGCFLKIVGKILELPF